MQKEKTWTRKRAIQIQSKYCHQNPDGSKQIKFRDA